MKNAQIVEMIKSGKPSHPVYQYVLLITYQVGDSRKILRKFDDFFELHLNLLGHFPEAAGGRSTSLRNLSDPDQKPTERILPELPAQMMFVSETVAAQRMTQLQDYISVRVW
jgi:PX domain